MSTPLKKHVKVWWEDGESGHIITAQEDVVLDAKGFDWHAWSSGAPLDAYDAADILDKLSTHADIMPDRTFRDLIQLLKDEFGDLLDALESESEARLGL